MQSRVDVGLDLDIVVGELVNNAVLHGSPPIEVMVTFEGGVLRIAVHDQDPDMGSPTPDSRGLAMVTRLATDWGITRDGDGGKWVWAELFGRY